MSINANITLNKILESFKFGNIDQAEAAGQIERLFVAEPVNYTRTPNPADAQQPEAS